MATKPRLADVLNCTKDDLAAKFNDAQAAGDFEPLPKGVYTAHIESGELAQAKSGTPSYKLTFRVCEGEHTGRKVWHDIWLTPAAIPMAKRDLAKIGVTKLEQLENPLPVGIRCELSVALRTSDDGAQFNKVRRYEVVGRDENLTDDDEFAPEAKPTEEPAAEAMPPLIDTKPESGSVKPWEVNQ